MITYVDTSSLLKLIVEEPGSDRVELVWNAADAVASASLVLVESRAALAAAERGGRLTASQHLDAKAELVSLVDSLMIVEVTTQLVTSAGDLAESQSLRGYDAVHLAAALIVESSIFASADANLCLAAERHGLHIANPLNG